MKRIIVMLSLLILSLHFTVSTFASSDTRTGNVVGGGSSDTLAGTSYSSSNSSSGGVDLTDPNATQDFITNELFGGQGMISPNVTTETIIKKLGNKGNDVVSILQIIGKFICITGFILCCILIVIGIVGNKKLLAGASIGLIISGLAYAGIVCGREIVNFIAAWAIS